MASSPTTLYTGVILKSQFLALLPYLGIKTIDWDKTKWPAALKRLSDRSVVGEARPVPRPPYYDEDCIEVQIEAAPIMEKFAEKVASCLHLDEVDRWIAVTDYGKYGPLRLVEFVASRLEPA